jgi:ribonuclease Z
VENGYGLPLTAMVRSGRGVEVVLTGTGSPISDPDRAGPGVLVRTDGTALQFDAGRATVMRLAAVGQPCSGLTAVFLTHHHSDHLLSLDDIALTRWLGTSEPLAVVAPDGPAAQFAKTVLDRWDDDISDRQRHMGRTDAPAIQVRSFVASPTPIEVWRNHTVRVTAVAVHHEPVTPAVAYRVDTSAGAVVISGDTRVCREVEELSHGATVLVHEAIRPAALARSMPGAVAGPIAAYHADSVELGALAARANVPTLALTHLIPAPRSPADRDAFVAEVRRGGYRGEIVVGRDLTTIYLGWSDDSSGTQSAAVSIEI